MLRTVKTGGYLEEYLDGRFYAACPVNLFTQSKMHLVVQWRK
jgi:hypothetical protein